jgi:hypothetical protein
MDSVWLYYERRDGMKKVFVYNTFNMKSFKRCFVALPISRNWLALTDIERVDLIFLIRKVLECT